MMLKMSKDDSGGSSDSCDDYVGMVIIITNTNINYTITATTAIITTANT